MYGPEIGLQPKLHFAYQWISVLFSMFMLVAALVLLHKAVSLKYFGLQFECSGTTC